jgi:hypothetical protein
MKTTTKALTLGAALLLPLVLASPGRAAVTVSVSPNPAATGQPVRVRSTAALLTTSIGVPGGDSGRWALNECGITIDFGDGASTGKLCTRTDVLCTADTTHTYRTPGVYVVTSKGECGSRSGNYFGSPTQASARLVVAAPTLNIATDPAIVRAPREQGATATVQYRAASPVAFDAVLLSASGRFEAGGETLATVATPLTLPLVGGAGTASESVRFAPEILRAAAERGQASVSYVRDFAAGGISGRAVVTALIITPAAEFALERMELAFENHRPEIVVQRGADGLAARALLRFTGAGMLRAYWEVDGRVLVPPVSRYLNLGDSADLVSPVLPTYDPGTHTVRCVVTSPVPPWPLPEIIYVVRPSDAPPKALAIRLAGPGPDETLPYQPALFRWDGGGEGVVYLVQFYPADGEAPVFSAWTRAREYRLPELLYRNLFLAGGRYRWKVSAYNAEENLAGESPAAAFGFAKP